MKVHSSIRTMGAMASKALAVGALAAVLATSGAVSGLAEAQAQTPAQARAASAARYQRRRAKAAAARAARRARQVRLAAARRARLAARRARNVSRSLPGGWRSAKVSWYGPGFYGHGMAGGGTLDPTSLVVAHKTLPFGTLIEFSYRGRTVVVPVKDRGPFVAGREFDLGPGTARALGMFHTGTLQYRIVGR